MKKMAPSYDLSGMVTLVPIVSPWRDWILLSPEERKVRRIANEAKAEAKVVAAELAARKFARRHPIRTFLNAIDLRIAGHYREKYGWVADYE